MAVKIQNFIDRFIIIINIIIIRVYTDAYNHQNHESTVLHHN